MSPTPPSLPPSSPSLQLFKASGGRGKLLQMCGFVVFCTATGRLRSWSGDSSKSEKSLFVV